MTRFASGQHYTLANAITDMASRYAGSMHRAGLAFGSIGTHDGKTWGQLEAAARRQRSALLRLTRALRDLDTKEVPAVPVPVAIVERRKGWELAAYRGDVYLGGAVRSCVVGSRGRAWYWAVQVGSMHATADDKESARADLLRLTAQATS